jgi:hypothetical protein
LTDRRAGIQAANCFVVHFLAARRISERTKAALAAAKARGEKLGSPIASESVGKARAARSAYAAKANETTRAVIRDVQASGSKRSPPSPVPWKPVPSRRRPAAPSGNRSRCRGCWRLGQVDLGANVGQTHNAQGMRRWEFSPSLRCSRANGVSSEAHV